MVCNPEFGVSGVASGSRGLPSVVLMLSNTHKTFLATHREHGFSLSHLALDIRHACVGNQISNLVTILI